MSPATSKPLLPIILALVLLLGVARCAGPVGGLQVKVPIEPSGATPSPQPTRWTATPTPEVFTPTPAPLLTATPTATWTAPAPVGTVPWPSPTPTPLQTPLADIPNAAVQILRPGEGSFVVSPMVVVVRMHRDAFPSTVFVELWAQVGNEARMLYRRIYRYDQQPATTWVLLQEKVPFEIRPPEVWARFLVRLTDGAGVPKEQQAVHIRLLRYGLGQESHRDQVRLPIVIERPRHRSRLPLEGTLEVTGLARYTTGVIEALLYTPKGRVLKAAALSLGPPDPQGYARFTWSWPYRFTRPQDLRLVLRLYDPRVQGVAYIESVLLYFRAEP